jgi:hypothetical protein
VFGIGKSAEIRAASGSIEPAGKIFVGAPDALTPIGTPQYPLGFRLDACTSRVLKISPTYVGLPLQSTAT